MSVITERFEVEREVGTGGMGTVFRALDRETGASVALKVLQKQLHSETERFLLEARVLAQLQHPAIVRYIAHGVTSEGAPFIAMEWLEGEDLWARLQQRVFTVEETVLLARRLAEALASAHAQGIVHRDIKPSNIFLEHGEVARVKLLDFGVARILDLQRQLTMTGTFLGTPAYTAPEQARGERHVGPEADVFSLGCVLFECLTGRGPFDADNVMAVLTRLLMEQPARLRDHRRDIPEAVATLVERMIIKDPKKRPANGAAVLTEICSLTWQNANAAAAAHVAAQAAVQMPVQLPAQVAAPYSAAILPQSSPSVIVSSPEPHSTPAERLARSGLMRRIEEPEPKKTASPFESQVTHIQPRLEGGPPPPARPSANPPFPSRSNPIPSQGSGSPTPSGSMYTPYGQQAPKAQPPSHPHPAQPAPYGPSARQSSPSLQAQKVQPTPHGSSAQPYQPVPHTPQHPPVVAPPPVPSASRPITARYAPPFAQPAPADNLPAPAVTTPSHPVNVPAPSGPSAVLPTPAPMLPTPAPAVSAPPAPPAPPAAPVAAPPPSFNRPAVLPAPPAASHARPPAVSQAPSTLIPGAIPVPHAPPQAPPHAPPTASHAPLRPSPTGAHASPYAQRPPTGVHPYGPSPTSAHPYGPSSTSAHPYGPSPTGAHPYGPPPTGSHDLASDQSPPTQAVPSRPAPPSSRPGSSQLKRYKLMGFAASLVEHREKPSNMSEISDQVYDLLAKYVSMPWAMMQSHCTRMGKDPYNLQRADLALIAEPLSKAITPFAGPKGAAVLLQELRGLA